MKESALEKLDASGFAKALLAGDRVVLSRAITLVESTNPEKAALSTDIIDRILPHTGHSFRLGITGVPGVGKSTFIEAFGSMLTGAGKKVAVLAVDPTSVRSKGSILGDKTRMESLSRNESAYIRPSPSAGALGGVTKVTYETMLLCEAAGFDFIIVETVGVGQSEIAVSRITDFFMLLMLAGAGDELQGIKRGIMEMADCLIVTKSDGDNEKHAKAARAEYARALQLLSTSGDWKPQALTCSAVTGAGMNEVHEMLLKYAAEDGRSGLIRKRRASQLKEILMEALQQELISGVASQAGLSTWLDEVVKRQNVNPYAEARQFLRSTKGI